MWLGAQGLSAQVAKTFYENGNLKSTVPLNEEGQFDGTGYTFYQTGEMAMETQYVAGIREGEEKEYYPDGTLLGACKYWEGEREGWYQGYYENGKPQLKQHWEKGKRQGPMWLYHPNGELRVFAMLEQDSTVFAQHFDEDGRLVNELFKEFHTPIDTALIGVPVVELEREPLVLEQGTVNRTKVYIPGVPTKYLSYFSPHGQILPSDDPQFPLALVPHEKARQFVLYLRIQTHPEARPILLKKVELPVQLR